MLLLVQGLKIEKPLLSASAGTGACSFESSIAVELQAKPVFSLKLNLVQANGITQA